MNWLLGNKDQKDNNEPSSNPDADELRRRRIAKLEEARTAQAAEDARRKEFEDRKEKWQASKRATAASAAADAAEASSTTAAVRTSAIAAAAPASAAASSSVNHPAAAPPPPPPPVPAAPAPVRPEGQAEPSPKRPATALPSVDVMVSRVVSGIFAISLEERLASLEVPFYPDLVAQLYADADVSEGEPIALNANTHADDILLNRINADQKPLEYIFSCYRRCGHQRSELNSNRRLQVEEHAQRRTTLHDTIAAVERRLLVYTGMLLTGAFMEIETASPQAFAAYLLDDNIPAGFIRALLNRHAEEDASLDDILPAFMSMFNYIRSRAICDSKLSSSAFLKPLNSLNALVAHKELCRLLVSHTTFTTEINREDMKGSLSRFSHSSYLYPFFQVSALPGAPAGMIPAFPEDPLIAASMFPNPSMLDRTEAEGAIFSLRSSLSVARNLLSQITLALCKAGTESRNGTLNWFATVFNFNQKRAGMQPDPRVTSRDGFMLNVMFVLLKLCEPIVAGGWKMLQKIDPTYPQSSHRLDYSDETRLAADTNMLKRWWVDQRNQNAQESLVRQLAVTARESGVSEGAASTSAASGDGAGPSEEDRTERKTVATEFNFVTELFWLTLRGIQLGFVRVVNLYEEEILRTLQRLREIVRDLEAAKDSGTLPADQEAQLTLFKRRFDMLLQAKLCYDVYLQDTELLTMLVRFVTADAEWLMKKMLVSKERESILPLPLPVDPTFASLPEHTVETITTVLLSTMHTDQRIVYEHSALLEEIVNFCVVGSASPLHIKNPYLRSKLIEFLSTIFPRNGADQDDDERPPSTEPAMDALFAKHQLSRKFLPGSLFRLYVDVEHTGSHTQFYDKFSIRYRIGSILDSLWYMPDYRKSVRDEARDESRFLRFLNMALNDANHLLDSVLDTLEELNSLETMIQNKGAEWEALTDEEKQEKQDHMHRLEGSARSHNHYANNNVKLLWMLTEDDVVRRVFLRDEMVSRMAEMLNYLLERLCGQRCNDLKVSDFSKVSWNPRKLLTRLIETYLHFHGEDKFATAVAKDGRSYKLDLFTRAIGIVKRRKILAATSVQKFEEVAAAAAKAHELENAEEEDLGEIPEEFLDPIMSVLMRNPVRLPTSGSVMDRAVISRILLSDKMDPFNRELLTEDMLEEDVELKKRIEAFVTEKKSKGQSSS